MPGRRATGEAEVRVDPMRGRPARGESPELSADAERAAERMLEDAIRLVLDRYGPLIVPAEPTYPPPAVELPATTAAEWLDNRRPGRYRRRP